MVDITFDEDYWAVQNVKELILLLESLDAYQ